MNESETLVCGTHGKTPSTFLCRHVAGGIACGFHASSNDPTEPWPDAWCDRCEEVLDAAGEWTDEAQKEADIKALCTHCYDESRTRNVTVPRFARGAAARLTVAEAQQLLHHAVHEAQAVQAASRRRWGWGDHDRWDYDDRANTLTLSHPKLPILVANTQFVGSYAHGTFQWAWKTLARDDPNYAVIARLPLFGEVRGISKLTTASWACEQAEGWEMTALASYLLGSEGMYRAPFRGGQQFWFMLLSNWRTVSGG